MGLWVLLETDGVFLEFYSSGSRGKVPNNSFFGFDKCQGTSKLLDTKFIPIIERKEQVITGPLLY